MSDGFKIQVNVKAGDELINLRADSGPEMEQIIEWVTNKAGDIQSVIALLKGANTVAAGLPGAQVVQQQTPPQQGRGWSQQGSGASASAPSGTGYGAPSQQSQAPAQGGDGQMCAHGAMQYRESKPGADRKWKGYFCPTPRGTAGQCAPVFLRG